MSIWGQVGTLYFFGHLFKIYIWNALHPLCTRHDTGKQARQTQALAHIAHQRSHKLKCNQIIMHFKPWGGGMVISHDVVKSLLSSVPYPCFFSHSMTDMCEFSKMSYKTPLLCILSPFNALVFPLGSTISPYTSPLGKQPSVQTASKIASTAWLVHLSHKKTKCSCC